MRRAAIRIIKDEHLAIAAVLYTLRHHVRQMREHGARPNFPLLRAIFDYIVTYPDRWHHPKEDAHLFAALSARTDAADRLIAELKAEHRLGHPMIEDLKRKLLAFELDPMRAAADFYAAVEAYVELEWAHMRKEEERLLPIAEAALTDEDWQRIHAAFDANDNPLFGLKPREDAERLYRRILALAPGIS